MVPFLMIFLGDFLMTIYRPVCGIHRLPGGEPDEGRGAAGTRMLLIPLIIVKH